MTEEAERTPLFLAIDEGTTSTRAMVFDAAAKTRASHGVAFKQYFPKPGWVEHDAEEIFSAVCKTLDQVISECGPEAIAAAGITNQRETVVVWERSTGKPIAPAIVWQDRRTAGRCQELIAAGHEDEIIRRSGLLPDPYFTATKLAWILDTVEGARARAENGRLCAGTIDSYLTYRLTGQHVTDHSNASRTLLYNLEKGAWDDALCQLLSVPMSILPEIVDCVGQIGIIKEGLPGAGIPLTGMAGDQQAASVGQACLNIGDAKATYGTGCFLLANAGQTPKRSANRLLSTVLFSEGGQRTFALEGAIFVAGSLIQWLRDDLGLVENAADTEALAASVEDTAGVVIVPALTGLGAPYWNPEARGAILGLTRGASKAHIIRAALEAQSYQTHDLLTAMAADGQEITRLRVDGGMVANNWLCQDLADVLAVTIDRPRETETTALGAAILAAVGFGHFSSIADGASMWAADRTFTPSLVPRMREARLSLWHDAVHRVNLPPTRVDQGKGEP